MPTKSPTSRRAYYLATREAVNRRRRERRAADPEGYAEEIRRAQAARKIRRSTPEHRAKENAQRRKYCREHPDRVAAQQRAWRKSSPELVKSSQLKCMYGLTLKELHAMQERQNGRCAICGNGAKLCVDHNHGTGKVRELLCLHCNQMIGRAKENVGVLNNAIAYLQKHNGFGEKV